MCRPLVSQRVLEGPCWPSASIARPPQRPSVNSDGANGIPARVVEETWRRSGAPCRAAQGQVRPDDERCSARFATSVATGRLALREDRPRCRRPARCRCLRPTTPSRRYRDSTTLRRSVVWNRRQIRTRVPAQQVLGPSAAIVLRNRQPRARLRNANARLRPVKALAARVIAPTTRWRRSNLSSPSPTIICAGSPEDETAQPDITLICARRAAIVVVERY